MSTVSAKLFEHSIDFFMGDSLFTTYKFAPSQSKPWFYPVIGPCGQSVTTETADPYPHHRSLWFGCDHLNGHDCWHEGPGKGRIAATGKAEIDHHNGVAEARQPCEWLTADGQRILRDERIIRVRAGEDDARLIDFDITLHACEGDITVTKTNHSLFAARVVPSLAVAGGGTLHNSMSDEAEAETFGKAAAWCDFSGPIAGTINGITIYDHPQNPWHPSPWFTRDYGFMSPTALYFLGDEGWKLRYGQPARFRYLVLIHAGDVYDGNSAVHWGEYASGY